ncbi:MAG: putative lipoprotein [Comamonadaceae bacterium]|nr:MAG: putative lipoprotein [Comamonadaceae bacterium]
MQHPQGIVIHGWADADAAHSRQQVLQALQATDLAEHVHSQLGTDAQGGVFQLWLSPAQIALWAPGLDTLMLGQKLQLDIVNSEADLLREIVLTLLMGPVAFEFPSLDELLSALRIRRNMVQAARKTNLAFHTSQAERPEDCWRYDEERGFVIRAGASLIDALIKATQPEVSGTLYAFSCYRASEYVIVLAIAQELAQCNPPLYQQLQTLWQQRPIRSGEFHEVFLREQGSMQAPLPPRYYVPGDRTWFRNPDGVSAEASGFEGSWVMYMGGGLFTNFWKRDQPYTLEQKCLEIYHWRNGLYFDEEGEERIDEDKVDQLVAQTRQDPAEVARIQALMQRYREARGIYTEAGGCIDTTREFARWVRPGTADLVLPAP